MMTIIKKQGSSLDVLIQVKKDGVPMSLSGRTCVYLVKESITDDDAAAKLRFDGSNGLAVPDAVNGWIRLTKTAAEFNLTPKKYFGALQITAGGEVIEIPDDAVFDVWVVLKQVVQATS